jgi:hypothetical protein
LGPNNNVWAKDGVREKIIERKLLTDKTFKLTSLQVNPLYKPIFDSLDAKAVKMLNELDKSVLWSRKYTKETFKFTFLYPGLFFVIVVFCCLNYGVKYRIYSNYIRHGRKLELADRMDIDLEDFENYPASVYYEYRAKKLYDKHLERKEEQIKKVEEKFHDH